MQASSILIGAHHRVLLDLSGLAFVVVWIGCAWLSDTELVQHGLSVVFA
mgnify:CR=1 FL=1